MFKKSLATALLVCTVPALANAAWFLSTQARSGGGYLDSFNKNGQVVTDGVLTTQQDVVADQSVSYTPTNTNFKVQKVTLTDTSVNGTSISVLYDLNTKAPVKTYPASYTVHPVDGHSYTVAASFAADYLPVSATIDNGTVTPTSVGNIYYGYKLTAPLTFTFSPKAGYTITAVNNLPTGASVVGLPATTNSRVTVTIAKGTELTAGFALSATAVNASPYVDAILPQTVTPGSVSIKAVTHNISTPAFTWSYVSGPKNVAIKSTVTVGKDQKVVTKVVPGPALAEFPTEVVNASGTSSVFTADPAKVTASTDGTASTAIFTAPSEPGQYKFMVTVGGVTKLATVNVVATATSASNQCQFCHTANKIGDPAVQTKWSASAHGNNLASSCASCHVGAGVGGHPGNPAACTSCHSATGVKPLVSGHVAQSNCASCHNASDPHATKSVASTNMAAFVNPSTQLCSDCHSSTNSETAKFQSSKHWNSSLEYSSYTDATHFDLFYNGAPTKPAAEYASDPNFIPSINPNVSYNVYEWTANGSAPAAPTAPKTCSTQCHFRAQKSSALKGGALYNVSGASGCLTCHSNALLPATAAGNGLFQNASSAHPGKLVLSSTTCEQCHYTATGTGHGQTTVEFHASKHWNNSHEYGPEFAGGAVSGEINPNEAWNTTENGAATSCAYSCHFKPNLGPLGAVKADGTPAKDGNAVNRPGLDGCLACHDPHKPTTDAASTCMECHTGKKHGGTTNGYKASVHYTSSEFHPTEEALYNSSTFLIVKSDCLACHNPHQPEQTTATASSLTAYKDLNPCALCHNGIAADGKVIAKVVHFGSISTTTKAFGASSYVGNAGRPRNNCTECHFKFDPHTVANFSNNTSAHVLSAWAGSAHGSTTGNWTSSLDDHMFNISDRKAGTSTARSTTTINEADTVSYSCVRCHTAKGIANFVTADAKHAVFTNISAVDIKYGVPSYDSTGKAKAGAYSDSSPLVCSGCHATGADGFTHSGLRPVPAAVGFYNVSTVLGKVVTKHTFPDLASSNICVACHAGVSGNGEAIKNVFAKYDYPATNSLINPHHGMAADSVTGYGLYEFGNYAALKNTHMTAGTTAQGPCVGCHFTSSEGHSLDAVDAHGNAVASVCTNCHGGNFNVTTAKANFDASLVVLKNALTAKGLPTKRAAAVWGTGTTGANNMGASMNYYVLYSARAVSNPSGGVDPAGYVHNPNYVKKAIFDSIDWVTHGSLTGSIADVLSNPAYTAGMTDQQIAAAQSALANLGSTAVLTNSGLCADCHAGDTVPGTNTNIVAEYATSGHAANSHGPTCTACHTSAAGLASHPVNGPMSKEYANIEANCLGCHNGSHSRDFDNINHYANTPDAAFSNISSSGFVGYKGKGINLCSNCHFGFDGHGIGAATTGTFTSNSDVLAAWSASKHGDRTGTAWTPGTGATGHDWRNSGSPANFQTTMPVNDCVRCHTAEGYANFVNSGYSNVNNIGASDGNRWNAPLSCNACHATDATTSVTAARLAAPAVITFYNISTVDKVTKNTVKGRTQVTFPDVSDSNLCISCHAARVSGEVLVKSFNNGLSMNNASFQNSHYDAAAGTMYMKAGFTAFVDPSTAIGDGKGGTTTYGKTLTSSMDMTGGVTSTHRGLGTNAMLTDSHFGAGKAYTTAPASVLSGGPCVTCHMGYSRNSAKGHSLAIDQDTVTQVCNVCHASEGGHSITNLADFKTYFLEPQSESFQKSLGLISKLLQTKYGIDYDATAYPYFFKTGLPHTNTNAFVDWTVGGTLSTADAQKLMGAAFNLNLLTKEPAAYAHARSYTRRLVYDSIDFLDDGQINLSVSATAVALDPADFGKGATAYSDGTLTTLATGTTEGMIFLTGWSRTDGTWTTPERP